MVAFLGGFLIFYQSRPAGQYIPANNLVSQQASNSEKWETKTDEQASITVMVTPLDLSPQSIEWKFNITMDTHSVELDQDLVAISILTDGRGNEYKPIRWDGPVSDHHREGVLIFNPITPYPQHLKLRINDIGDIQRFFTWILIEK